MGDEADYFDYDGVADPKIVAALKLIDSPPSDPTLLAAMIDKYAGQTLDFGLVGYDAALRDTRRSAHKLLVRLQVISAELLGLGGRHADLDILADAVHDSLAADIPAEPRAIAAEKVIQALSVLAVARVAPDLNAFNTKPGNDEAVGQVVLAVAYYCLRQRIRFTGYGEYGQSLN